MRQASLRYAGAFLFRDLDFALPGGHWTCLLGPSGVGKSSLLRADRRARRRWSGARCVCSDGRPLAGRLAWMGQRDDLLPWLSVLDNVTLGARLRGEPADRAQARDLLARVGLVAQQATSCRRPCRAASASAPRSPAR